MSMGSIKLRKGTSTELPGRVERRKDGAWKQDLPLIPSVAIRELLEKTLDDARKRLPGRVYSRELIELLFRQRHRNPTLPGKPDTSLI